MRISSPWFSLRETTIGLELCLQNSGRLHLRFAVFPGPCCQNDRFEVVSWLPVKDLARSVGACNEMFRIARASTSLTCGNFFAGMALNRCNDLAHAVSPACAQVEGLA